MPEKLGREYETIVIGGGFYGCTLAAALAAAGQQVVILERESDLLLRAYYVNQARVSGHPYPSYLTGLRSAGNFPRFVTEFQDCIADTFEHVYAIARNNSNVSSNQFRNFCESLGASLGSTSQRLRNLFNPTLIEDTFSVTECAFDAGALRQKLRARLLAAGVSVCCGITVRRVSSMPGGRLAAHLAGGGVVLADRVFNCTYSAINHMLIRSGLKPLPLKLELAEVAMISVPDSLEKAGITIVDGPFFSTMPFPPRSLHSLTHVRYTPRYSWRAPAIAAGLNAAAPRTNFPYMIKDAQRYVPSLRYVDYEGSLFEVSVRLGRNEVCDGRPILFRKDYGFENFSIVLGSKVDNIYDALSAVREAGLLEEVLNGARV